MKKLYILSLLLIFSISLASASFVSFRVEPVDSAGKNQYNETIEYTINFTTSADCSGVLLSDTQIIFTNNSGSSYINVDISSLTSNPNYICEYRNGTLSAVHNSSSIVADIVRANYLHGDGSNLTNVNYTETDSLAYNGTLALNSTFSYYAPLEDILAFNYYNSTDFSISDYISTSGGAINGTLNITDGILRILPDARLIAYDSDDEAHDVSADLERLDEIRANTFTTELNMSTFSNSTGNFVNISGISGQRISVILKNGTTAESTRFSYSNIILGLNEGTEDSPIMNWISVQIVDGSFQWVVSTSAPTNSHALACKVLSGATQGTIYMASLSEETSFASLKQIQKRFKLEGLFYISDFDYTATNNYLNIGIGKYFDGISEETTDTNINSSSGFYVVLNNGSYVQYDTFDDFVQYADGGTISANRYFNVVFGIVPYNGNTYILAVPQDEPTTEYTSIADAWGDSENTINIFPSNQDLERHFLPIARMIMKKSDVAQILPTGLYAEDNRGAQSKSSSGGGVAETDPLSIHADGTIPLTSNWNQGAFNLTNTNSWFLGLINWSSVKNVPFSIADYFTKAEILAFNYYNSTDFSISNYFTKTDILGFGYYNSTNAYTKTYLDGEFTDALNTSFTNQFVDIDGDIMTGNLNMSNNNVTQVDCILFDNGAKWCSA